MEERKIAMYVRLSNDDKNSGSASLETQERIIREKLALLPEYEGQDPILFCDNGYSGRNMDRPAITELLELVKRNEIACILVKDFSRTGRDMIQVGYLLESVFPLFQTRFISVNDSYDSNAFYEDTGGINVTFKYLLAEYYSRDLSKKIKAGKQAKIKRGEHVVNNPVFGYVLDENRQFIIDEKAADIIRYLFQLAIEGNPIAEIRKILYEKKIPTRSEYRKYVLDYKQPLLPKIQGAWEHSTIMQVLRNEQYIGTYIGGRKISNNDGTRNTHLTPESEWVKIPDHHPAIIEKETFEEVQSIFPKRKKRLPTREQYPMKSRVFCACCGHTLNRTGNKTFKYDCKMGRDLPDMACNHFAISERELHEKIFTILKEQALKILALPQVDDEEEAEVVSKSYVARKRQLYEDVTKGNITQEEYLECKVALEDEIQKANYLYKKKEESRLARRKELSDREECVRLARLVKKSETLSTELCLELIEKVEVFPDLSVKLQFVWESFGLE